MKDLFDILNATIGITFSLAAVFTLLTAISAIKKKKKLMIAFFSYNNLAHCRQHISNGISIRTAKANYRK